MGRRLATMISINQRGKILEPSSLATPTTPIRQVPLGANGVNVTGQTQIHQPQTPPQPVKQSSGWPSGWTTKLAPDKGALYIDPIPFAALVGWFQLDNHNRKEIAGFGAVEIKKVGKENDQTDGEVLVWVSHVAVGQGAAVHITHEQAATSLKLFSDHLVSTGKQLSHNLQWHTHPHFNPYWSGTDLGDQRETITDAIDVSPGKGIFYFIVFDRLHFVGRKFWWDDFMNNKIVNQQDLVVRLSTVKDSILAPYSPPTQTYAANQTWYNKQRDAAKETDEQPHWQKWQEAFLNNQQPLNAANKAKQARTHEAQRVPVTGSAVVPQAGKTTSSGKNDKPENTRPIVMTQEETERLHTLYNFLLISEDTAFLEGIEFASLEYASWALTFADFFYLNAGDQLLSQIKLTAAEIQKVFVVLERFKMFDVLKWAKQILVKGIADPAREAVENGLPETEVDLTDDVDDIDDLVDDLDELDELLEVIASALCEAFDSNDLLEVDILLEQYDVNEEDTSTLCAYFKSLEREDVARYLASRWKHVNYIDSPHTIH